MTIYHLLDGNKENHSKFLQRTFHKGDQLMSQDLTRLPKRATSLLVYEDEVCHHKPMKSQWSGILFWPSFFYCWREGRLSTKNMTRNKEWPNGHGVVALNGFILNDFVLIKSGQLLLSASATSFRIRSQPL